MKKKLLMPKMLILSCLSVSLLTLGFSSWVFGGNSGDIIVDVGASSVFDPSSIFKLNKKDARGGYQNPIEGIKVSNKGYGILGDGMYGNEGFYGVHFKINLREIQDLVSKADNSFTFSLDAKYAVPGAARANDYLSQTITTAFSLSASYLPSSDYTEDASKKVNITSGNITYQTNPSSFSIPNIKVSGLELTKIATDQLYKDQNNIFGTKDIINYVYIGIKFSCVFPGDSVNSILEDNKTKDKVRVVFTCNCNSN